jgi:hypothetical protein
MTREKDKVSRRSFPEGNVKLLESISIPGVREKITSEIIKEYISNNEIRCDPTHHQLCVPIINRIYQKMVHNLKFDDIKICDNLIIDGHHRYISSLLARKAIGNVPTHKTSATKIYKWKEIEFVNAEWDTTEKIDKLNMEDARFNNVPLVKIYEMTR